jgi:hypothetical protein
VLFLVLSAELEDEARALDGRERSLVDARPLFDTHDPPRTPSRMPISTRCPWTDSRSLSLAFWPVKRTKSRSTRGGAARRRGADLEVVGVGDEVGHVERGAEVARDVGAEVEIDRRVAGGQVVRRAPAFST